MAHYDTGAMRTCATDIQNQITTGYQPAKDAIDTIVNTMKGYFNDDVSTQFSTKYTNEAKVSAENVQALMLQYVSLLNQTAEQYDKVIDTGLSGLGG